MLIIFWSQWTINPIVGCTKVVDPFIILSWWLASVTELILKRFNMKFEDFQLWFQLNISFTVIFWLKLILNVIAFIFKISNFLSDKIFLRWRKIFTTPSILSKGYNGLRESRFDFCSLIFNSFMKSYFLKIRMTF